MMVMICVYVYMVRANLEIFLSMSQALSVETVITPPDNPAFAFELWVSFSSPQTIHNSEVFLLFCSLSPAWDLAILCLPACSIFPSYLLGQWSSNSAVQRKKTNTKCRCHQWTDALKAEEGFSLRDLTMFSTEAGQFFPVSVESTSLFCDILMDQIFSKNSVFVNVPVVNILTCCSHRRCMKVGLHCALKSGESKTPALSSWS